MIYDTFRKAVVWSSACNSNFFFLPSLVINVHMAPREHNEEVRRYAAAQCCFV